MRGNPVNEPEYIIVPEADFEPATTAYYAYGLEAAKSLQAEKQTETGRGWKLYLRVA